MGVAKGDHGTNPLSYTEEKMKKQMLEMWANVQRGGRPAEYRWRPLFNATVWLPPTSRVPCSNAAGVPLTTRKDLSR